MTDGEMLIKTQDQGKGGGVKAGTVGVNTRQRGGGVISNGWCRKNK